MRHPKPFTVIQNGKPLFTIHAYSLEQARAIVAAKVAGETIVVGPEEMFSLGTFHEGASR